MARMRIIYDGTPITDDIITVADIKEHLRVEHTEDDDLITAIRATAIGYCEDYCGTKLGQYAATGYLDHFENSVIPGGPINSLSAVKYKAIGYTADLTTLSISNYYYDADTTPGRISFINVPSLEDYEFNRVQVTMNIGHTTSDIPPAFISAIKLICGHLYENRQAEMMNLMPYGLRIGVESLLNPHRILFQP